MIRFFPHVCALVTILAILTVNFGQLANANLGVNTIDPITYLGCFTDEPDAQYTVSLLICRKKSQSGMPFNRSHFTRRNDDNLFLELRQISSNANLIRRYIGISGPCGSWVNAEMHAGIIEMSLEFQLSAPRFKKIIQAINEYPDDSYCNRSANFAIIKVLKSADVQLPDYNSREFLYDSTPVGSFKTNITWLEANADIEEWLKKIPDGLANRHISPSVQKNAGFCTAGK